MCYLLSVTYSRYFTLVNKVKSIRIISEVNGFMFRIKVFVNTGRAFYSGHDRFDFKTSCIGIKLWIKMYTFKTMPYFLSRQCYFRIWGHAFFFFFTNSNSHNVLCLYIVKQYLSVTINWLLGYSQRIANLGDLFWKE